MDEATDLEFQNLVASVSSHPTLANLKHFLDYTKDQVGTRKRLVDIN